MLIAFDRDEAGDRAAAALGDRLGAMGVECFRVLFPAGQDANSFAVQIEEPAGALAQLLREAVWIGAGEPAAPSSRATPRTSAAVAVIFPQPPKPLALSRRRRPRRSRRYLPRGRS